MQCLDAITLRTYAPVGTCGSDGCTYAHSDTTCESGCNSGACIGACAYAEGEVSCPAPANASPMCASATCGWKCNTGFTESGASCPGSVTSGWTQVSTGATNTPSYHSVWGASATELYVGDSFDTVWRTTDGGQSWAPAALGTSGLVTRIWGVSGDGFDACGDALYRSVDGTSFASVGFPSCKATWGTSTTDIWLDGFHSTDGTTWSAVPDLDAYIVLAVDGRSAMDTYVLGVVALNPAAGQVVRRGARGLRHPLSTEESTSWSTVYQSSVALNAIDGVSTDRLVVGAGGTMLHSSNVTGWTAVTSPTTQNLSGVWYAPDGSYWVIGDDVILHGHP